MLGAEKALSWARSEFHLIKSRNETRRILYQKLDGAGASVGYEVEANLTDSSTLRGMFDGVLLRSYRKGDLFGVAGIWKPASVLHSIQVTNKEPAIYPLK